MFGIPTFKIVVAAALAVLLALAGAYVAHTIKQSGRDEVKLQAAEDAAQAEKDRNADDARIQAMSDRDLCIRHLSRSYGGVQHDTSVCDQFLLGVPSEQPEPGRNGGVDPR